MLKPVLEYMSKVAYLSVPRPPSWRSHAATAANFAEDRHREQGLRQRTFRSAAYHVWQVAGPAKMLRRASSPSAIPSTDGVSRGLCG